MRWLERIEKHFNWLAFPGLLKYLTFLGLVVFFTQLARPDIAQLLDFDRVEIMKGEVWRVFTYIFAPQGLSFSMLGVFFVVCAMMGAILISDSMEEIWGATRTTLYLLLSWLGLTVAQFILGGAGFMAGGLMILCFFFAFATYFPKVEFRFMFFIPIQARIIAWISLAILVLSVVFEPVFILLVLPAMLPYALWVLPEVIRGKAALAGAAVRRTKFNSAQLPKAEAFHRCETCARTEKTDPYLNFFTLPDGKEYCADHLPEEFATKR